MAAVLLTVAVPLFVAKQMQLGSYAKSPQEVRVGLGSTVVVAGGRAKIWFAGGQTGGDFEVSCSKDSRYFQPAHTEEPVQACGITVELKKIDEGRPAKATFKVSWDK